MECGEELDFIALLVNVEQTELDLLEEDFLGRAEDLLEPSALEKASLEERLLTGNKVQFIC